MTTLTGGAPVDADLDAGVDPPGPLDAGGSDVEGNDANGSDPGAEGVDRVGLVGAEGLVGVEVLVGAIGPVRVSEDGDPPVLSGGWLPGGGAAVAVRCGVLIPSGEDSADNRVGGTDPFVPAEARLGPDASPLGAGSVPTNDPPGVSVTEDGSVVAEPVQPDSSSAAASVPARTERRTACAPTGIRHSSVWPVRRQ